MADDGADIVFDDIVFDESEFETPYLAAVVTDAVFRINNPRRSGPRPIETDLPEHLVGNVKGILGIPEGDPFRADMTLIENASENFPLPTEHEVWFLAQVYEYVVSDRYTEWIRTLAGHPRVVSKPIYRCGAETVIYRVRPL